MAKEDERRYLFSYLEERFGIPEEAFDDYLLFKRKKSWSLIKSAPQLLSASQLKISKGGVRAFQRIGSFLKPTTRMIQIFGHAATKARLEIDEKQLLKLVAKDELAVDVDLGQGYVILVLREKGVLGLGLFINGKVRSQMPRKELTQAMVHISPSPPEYSSAHLGA